jgi:hypothetical protein
MVEGASPVADATDRLLGDLADAVPALRAVGDALRVLADGLGVEKVIVAVDDARLGRQVFCSGRVPLGEAGVGLSGPPGAWTQPPRSLDETDARLLVRAVAAGVVRSTASRRPAPVAAATTPAVRSTGVGDAVTAAAARAVRHGWGFTLVLARGAVGLHERLGASLRAADSLIAVSDHEVALLLPQTAGDRVPLVLTRLASGSAGPPFSYGLACCPADGTDAAALCQTATERLEEAVRAASRVDA